MLLNDKFSLIYVVLFDHILENLFSSDYYNLTTNKAFF